MRISSITHREMDAFADAKELGNWLWLTRCALSTLFIVLLPARLYQFQEQPVCVSSNWRQYLKLVSSLLKT